MSETLGGDFIYTTLNGDVAVKAITAAIYNARMIPETETSLSTVNFYVIGNYDARLEYFTAQWAIDCRAASGGDSMRLALAVRDAMNRLTTAVGGFDYNGTVQIGGTIPPLDQADVHNTPVTLTVKRR